MTYEPPLTIQFWTNSTLADSIIRGKVVLNFKSVEESFLQPKCMPFFPASYVLSVIPFIIRDN